jgi:hypothetical protein
VARNIEVKILGDASSLKRELNSASDSTKKAHSHFLSLGKAAAISGGAAGIGLLTVGLEKSVHAAIDAEESQGRLAQSLKNAHIAMGPLAGSISKVEASSRRLGFTDSDVRDSLGSLVTATHNYQASVKDLAVAEDIARFKHVGLSDASKMLTMAMTGSQRAAKQLGITVIPVTTNVDKLKASQIDLTTATGKAALAHAKLQDKMATGQAVIEAVKGAVHGQAVEFSKSAAGGMEQFHAQIQHIEVAVGEKLLPQISRFIHFMADLADQLGKSETFHRALAAAADVLKTAWDAGSQVLQSLSKMLSDHRAELDKLGAFLQATLVPVLKATFFVWKTEMKVVIAVIGGLIDAVAAIVTAVDKMGSAVVSFFEKLPGRVKDAFTGAWGAAAGAITGLFDGIKGHVANLIRDLIGYWADLPGKIAAAVRDKAGELWEGVKHIFDKLPGFIKDALGIHSPSRVFEEIGEAIIHGAIKGIENKAGDLRRAAEDAFSSIPGKLVSTGPAREGNLAPQLGRGGSGIVALGHALQGMGFQVSENPAFGGVSPVHAPGSYHYLGRAIDVNWPGGGARELTHLRQAFSYAKGYHPVEEMIEDIGRANQHLHVALAKGGIVTRPTMALVGEKGPEAVIPLSRGGIGGSGTLEVHFHGGTFIGSNPDQVARDLEGPMRRALLRTQQRNGNLGFAT